MGLDLDLLREANTRRLPLFKNNLGERAHSEPDGSDWLLSQWANAMAGELGESAEEFINLFMLFTKLIATQGKISNEAKKIDRGDVTLEEVREKLGFEIADYVIYADIFAFRAGINLSEAIINKFNKTSDKVGVPVFIGDGCIESMRQICENCRHIYFNCDVYNCCPECGHANCPF